MTLRFFMMPAELIFTSQVGGIILQMLDSHHQMCCLYLIEVCGTICLNGIVPRKRKLFIFSFSIFTDVFPPSPCNPKELFNLRHASARNAIERIFGILKRRFRILQLPPEYNMDVQAMIPPALAALHNFIREYDPDEIHMYDEDELLDLHPNLEPVGELGTGRVTPDETVRAKQRRDDIADAMWEQYQHYLEGRRARRK